MLEKAKLALRISNTVFDQEILDLIAAGAADIALAGPEITVTPVKNESEEVVNYTVTDPLTAKALITYVRLNFGSPADYDRLKASYDEQKGQLRETAAYGMEALR